MSCCSDCADTKVEKARTVVKYTLDLTNQTFDFKKFWGANPKIIDVYFDQESLYKSYYGILLPPATDFVNAWYVTIYHKMLPFDEIVLTLALNPTTGEFKHTQLKLLPSSQLTIIMEVDLIPEGTYQELGDGVYRLPNQSTAIALLDDLDITKELFGSLKEHFQNNRTWPMLLTHHDQDRAFAWSPKHPTFKNDSLWQ